MPQFSSYNFKGKKALIRVDFNVPLDEQYHITDDTRITATIPTIKKILSDGGSVILMSHLGRPKGGPEDKFSLKHLVPHVSQLLGTEVQFANDCIGAEAVEKARAMQPARCCSWRTCAFIKKKKKAMKALPRNYRSWVTCM
jgi:phosphoglycerate kinase